MSNKRICVPSSREVCRLLAKRIRVQYEGIDGYGRVLDVTSDGDISLATIEIEDENK